MKITCYAIGGGLPRHKQPVFSSSVFIPGVKTLEIGDRKIVSGFEGFGVAITGSSSYVLSLMRDTDRAALLRDIFTKDGLDLSVGRLTVGSSDYSAELYSYDDVEDDVELKHFSIEHDMAYVVPAVKEILSLKPDIKLFSSPWSPPGWMKTSGSLCGGYMRDKYVEVFADYYIKFLEAYRDLGINISALTPQNEPETQEHGLMPACIWSPDTEAAFISALSRKLKEKKLDVDIWAFDHNFDGYTRVMDMFRLHPEIENAVKAVAFHYYRGSVEMIGELLRAHPTLEWHFTEGGPRLYDNYATDWCKWSVMMVRALNMGCKSFCGWNLMLDETGGPNIGPFFCGGLVTRNSSTGELSYSGQYKAFGQFSPFIKRGATVYEAKISHNTTAIFGFPQSAKAIPIEALGAQNPDGSFVTVLVNSGEEKQQVQYFRGGKWWYFELLPDSVVTAVFDE